MKETQPNSTSTSKGKKLVYSVIVAVCALLLIAATVLTVYFVTQRGNEIVEKPPVEQPPVEEPPVDEPPVENPPKQDPPVKEPDDGPSKPSGGTKVAFIKPVDSTVCSLEYDVVYNNTSLDKWYKHMAVDFVADAGTQVSAMSDGTVVEISMDQILGNYIVLEHKDGVTTTYRFVEPVSNLRKGDSVKQGQVIATVAEAYGTEYKDGSHLHLEMTVNGKTVDPSDYIDVTLEEK